MAIIWRGRARTHDCLQQRCQPVAISRGETSAGIGDPHSHRSGKDTIAPAASHRNGPAFSSFGNPGSGARVRWYELLILLAPPDIPRLDQVAISREVLAFALGLSLLTGILFGIAPALNALRTSPQRSLKDAGRASTGSASVRL